MGLRVYGYKTYVLPPFTSRCSMLQQTHLRVQLEELWRLEAASNAHWPNALHHILQALLVKHEPNLRVSWMCGCRRHGGAGSCTRWLQTPPSQISTSICYFVVLPSTAEANSIGSGWRRPRRLGALDSPVRSYWRLACQPSYRSVSRWSRRPSYDASLAIATACMPVGLQHC